MASDVNAKLAAMQKRLHGEKKIVLNIIIMPLLGVPKILISNTPQKSNEDMALLKNSIIKDSLIRIKNALFVANPISQILSAEDYMLIIAKKPEQFVDYYAAHAILGSDILNTKRYIFRQLMPIFVTQI